MPARSLHQARLDPFYTLLAFHVIIVYRSFTFGGALRSRSVGNSEAVGFSVIQDQHLYHRRDGTVLSISCELEQSLYARSGADSQNFILVTSHNISPIWPVMQM